MNTEGPGRHSRGLRYRGAESTLIGSRFLCVHRVSVVRIPSSKGTAQPSKKSDDHGGHGVGWQKNEGQKNRMTPISFSIFLPSIFLPSKPSPAKRSQSYGLRHR